MEQRFTGMVDGLDEVLSRKFGSVALANLLVAGSGERGLAATGSRYAAVMLSTKWEAASVRPEKYLSRSSCVQCAFLREEGVSLSALFLLLASLRLVAYFLYGVILLKFSFAVGEDLPA